MFRQAFRQNRCGKQTRNRSAERGMLFRPSRVARLEHLEERALLDVSGLAALDHELVGDSAETSAAAAATSRRDP